MKAVILAGGFGTRLKQLGENTPKGLLNQRETPLMSHICQEISKIDEIDQVALVANGKYAPKYQSWLNNNFPEVLLLNNGVFEPEKRLGALGDLHYTLNQLSWYDEPILVLPSDTYFQFSLNQILEIYKSHQTFVTVVRDVQDKSIIAGRLGCAKLNNGELIEFYEKPLYPPTTLASIPFYLYNPETLKLLGVYKDDNQDMDAPGSIIPWLLQKKIPIHALEVSSMTLDVGTPEDVSRLQELD